MKTFTHLALLMTMMISAKNLSAQCESNFPVMDNFDTNNIGVCWQTTDSDGDNRNWLWFSYYQGPKVIASYSSSTSAGALTPDNWIVSYPIDLTSLSSNSNIELSWKIRAGASWAPHEYYSVYVATGNQINNFTSSSVKQSEYVDEVGGAANFVTRTIDVSSLAGSMVYIAFRHHNSTNQSALEIDQVSINTATLSVNDFDESNFKYHYNSNDKTLTLQSSNMPITNVKIYNLLGQSIVSKKVLNNIERINLSNISKGVYLAHIEINNSAKTIKFIKH